MPLPPLEPEREPLLARRGFRLIAVAVVVLGAVVAGLVLALSGTSKPASNTRSTLHPPGRLLTYDDATGTLVFENADGSHRLVTAHALSGNPLMSPDGRYLLTDSGNDLFRVGADEVHDLRSPTSSTNGTATTPSQPFADHDRFVVVPRHFSTHARVMLVPRAGGNPTGLGPADDVAGDPTAMAAYVTVAAGHKVPAPSDPSFKLQPDGRVEWREAGQPARVLVTAARLDQLAGLPSGLKVSISVTPSPDGTRVLVYASSLDTRQAGSILAVFDGRGRLMDKVAGSTLTGGYWSPVGDELAYFEGRGQLIVWKPGVATVQALPVPPSPTSPWSGCVWAPDSTWLTCSGRALIQDGKASRLLVDVSHRRTEVITTSDEPLVWQK